MDMRVNPETILNVFVPSRGTRFLIPRQKLLSITSLIGFRPLSGYSISNRGHYDIEELRAEVFVPSRGTRFLIEDNFDLILSNDVVFVPSRGTRFLIEIHALRWHDLRNNVFVPSRGTRFLINNNRR